jgi:hypothetical protein
MAHIRMSLRIEFLPHRQGFPEERLRLGRLPLLRQGNGLICQLLRLLFDFFLVQILSRRSLLGGGLRAGQDGQKEQDSAEAGHANLLQDKAGACLSNSHRS